MKKQYLFNLIAGLGMLIIFPATTLAQEDEEIDTRPVRDPWGTIRLVDNPTTLNLYKGALHLEINHRFSEITRYDELLGIFGTANTRLAINYGITDKIQAGFGTTKDYKLQEFEWKVALLTQTRSNSMPVSLSYYGNAVIDARGEENFAPGNKYKFNQRMSYLTQVVASHKVGSYSFLLTPSVAWFNGVADGHNNFNAAVSVGVRAQVIGFHSLILEYDQPLTSHEAIETYPNLAFGAEIGTSTHSFRVFACNANTIVKQYNMFYNTNNPWENILKFEDWLSNFRFGFNISIALR